jgi:phage terminase large subunit-like protein
MIERSFTELGQGTQSMSPALLVLEEALLAGNLAHGGHPVLSMCVSHAVVVINDAGDRKLSKKRSTARIDGLVGLTMAIGVAPLEVTKEFDITTMIG